MTIARMGAFLAAASLYGAGTTAWEMNSYQDFIRGQFSGVSLSRDGRIMLSPKLDRVFSSDQPVIWALAKSPDGTIYAASGHRGRLFRIDRSGKSELVWTAEQPEIFALAVDAKGVVYAGTSPDGKVYRINGGKAEEFFSPQAKYIWALAFGRDGALYVGTGDAGKVFRVEAPGRGEVWYETGQSHVTALGVDSQGRLLAGTEPNGILYRISGKDSAFVLYDAALPEIRSIVTTPDGAIYAAALGGSTVQRATAASASQAAGSGNVTVTAPTTTITVEAAEGGLDVKPKPEQAKPPAATSAPQVTAAAPTVMDLTGVEKSALYRILPDNTVETLWSSKEENAYDLLSVGDNLVFSTDGQGRIYRMTPDRKLTLLVQTNEGEATRLLHDGTGLLTSTSNMGKIFRLGDGWSPSGSYESPVHDANTVARWGTLSWRSETCAGCSLSFRTRSGNSARPDRTWSDWSAPMSQPGPVKSQNARYLQWKAEITAPPGTSPVIDSVAVAYLPQNTAPSVKSITVAAQISATASAVKPTQPAASSIYSITVTDTGDPAPSTSTGTPTQTLSRAADQQLNISWVAEDPDNDKLVYNLYFRGEGEREWKLLKGNMAETSFNIEADVLADGRYHFRVTATDRLVNPPTTAREGELTSAPVLIDNTPPVLAAGPPRRSGSVFEAEVTATDAASPLRRCEYSVDAGPWTPLLSADGVIDSERETIPVRIDSLPPGEHIVVVRAYDAAGNPGLLKMIVR